MGFSIPADSSKRVLDISLASAHATNFAPANVILPNHEFDAWFGRMIHTAKRCELGALNSRMRIFNACTKK